MIYTCRHLYALSQVPLLAIFVESAAKESSGSPELIELLFEVVDFFDDVDGNDDIAVAKLRYCQWIVQNDVRVEYKILHFPCCVHKSRSFIEKSLRSPLRLKSNYIRFVNSMVMFILKIVGSSFDFSAQMANYIF